MAGDWIKMRGNLWDDPRVSGLCDQTGAQEAAIIGGLYWLWTTADQHTEDGVLPGMTLRAIDRKTGIESFGQALISIGWINELDDGILIVRFDEHNGTSAKRRCMEAQRKANSRKLSANDADITPTENGQSRTDCGAREEKRRELKDSCALPAGFAEFWSVYPKKKSKGAAVKAWKRIKPSAELVEQIVRKVDLLKRTDQWVKDGGQFIPHPASWLNAMGWEDDVDTSVTASGHARPGISFAERFGMTEAAA